MFPRCGLDFVGYVHLLPGPVSKKCSFYLQIPTYTFAKKMNPTKERPQHLGTGYSPNFAVWRQEQGINCGCEERKGMFPATQLFFEFNGEYCRPVAFGNTAPLADIELICSQSGCKSITRITLHESEKSRAQGLCKKVTKSIVVQVMKL